MTNIDRIKLMDEWELARLLYCNCGKLCLLCTKNNDCDGDGNCCIIGVADWLLSDERGKAIMGEVSDDQL